MTIAKSTIILSFAAALLALGGCASTGTSNQKSLLSAAGFHVRTPETPKQHQFYAAIPAYKIQRASMNGKIFYAYKDEQAGVAYVGGEKEYQQYQQIAIQQHVTQENYAAAEMNHDSAELWHDAWRRRSNWWGF